CLPRRVTALFRGQLIGRHGGGAMLREEALRIQTVATVYCAQDVSAADAIPGPFMDDVNNSYWYDAHVFRRHPIAPDIVAMALVSPTSPSTRRWPARSRPGNLPGGNGAPRPSPRSALANRGQSRDSNRWPRANQARP